MRSNDGEELVACRDLQIEAEAPPTVGASSGAVAATVFLAAIAFCLTSWSSPPIALALGMALAVSIGNPFPVRSKLASKWLLQGCVVALGFGMDLKTVFAAGANGALFAAASISVTLALGYALGRLLRLRAVTSLLISVGTAICGGSAIAAVGAVVTAPEADMSVALGTVFLLNAVALYVFPLAGHMLHMSQMQFGTWAGIAIHDISSVVGAAAHYGNAALEIATAVKLSRALWIVPVAAAVALIEKRRHSATSRTPTTTENQPRRIAVPWFIVLFLLASLLRTESAPVAAAAPYITHVGEKGLTLTLFLIGAGLSRNNLRTVGMRPLVQGVVLWLVISLGSLTVIMHGVP